MAQFELRVTFYKDGIALWSRTRGRRDKKFSKREGITLLAALNNKSTIQDARVTDHYIRLTPTSRAKPDDFRRDVLAVAREFFEQVKVSDWDKSRPSVGTKRLAHIVYLTDPRLTQVVIVLPGKVTGEHYFLLERFQYFLVERFQSFGKIEILKEPFRLHINVRRIDRSFERRFMAEVVEYFKVGRIERCDNATIANERIIPGMR